MKIYILKYTVLSLKMLQKFVTICDCMLNINSVCLRVMQCNTYFYI